MPNEDNVYFYGKKFILDASQSICLIFFAMLYLGIMISNAVLTGKWIAIGKYFVFGGAFVSPLLFILSDIIAEIFGYSVAKKIIWFSFISQTIFALIIQIMLQTPSPSNWHEQHSFSKVLGPVLRIDLSGFFAFMISGMINIFFITRWKILLRGRFFWLRSIGSSTIAEGCYSAIAILMIGLGDLPLSTMLQIIAITYAIKVIYSILLAYPGTLVVNYIRYKFKVDVYETSSGINPFLASQSSQPEHA
ncbi:MAG TPA: queuosine precursor transporter [Gammaproteobacteria bacterium]|nr:queuosine precursor transporter [Gammaproteobacteria bacterium]